MFVSGVENLSSHSPIENWVQKYKRDGKYINFKLLIEDVGANKEVGIIAIHVVVKTRREHIVTISRIEETRSSRTELWEISTFCGRKKKESHHSGNL